MRWSVMTLALLVLCLGASVEVQAQPAPGTRPQLLGSVFVSINGLYQAGSNDFEDSATIRENAENGRLETDYSVGTGPAFDLSVGVVIWRNLAIGVGVTRFSTSTTTALSASVPHPFFFNQPRAVEGEFSGDRTEVAVHVQVRAVFPVNDRVQVTVFGGPSFFQVDQSIVSDFDYAESYPYDTATFSRAIAEEQSESKVGVNVGGDVSYFFSRQIGVGVTAQYSGATVEMPVPSGTADVKAGGGQIGGGLRLRF
jgi:outer membrane protein with beta-barrel domain